MASKEGLTSPGRHCNPKYLGLVSYYDSHGRRAFVKRPIFYTYSHKTDSSTHLHL